MSITSPPNRSRRWLALCAVLRLLCLIGTGAIPDLAAPERNRPITASEVEAAFLLNFAKFVEWPRPPENRPKTSFSICILGEDPFRATLDQLVSGETVNGRPLIVKRIEKLPSDCDVLFVAQSELDLAGLLKQAGPGMLTVGESPEFLKAGGMINFVIEGRRVRFDVNRASAERAGLQLSSRLLGVARNVLK